MPSILQTISAFPSLQRRYGHLGDHAEICTIALPANCVECQMRKIADGLLSGRCARISHETKSGDQAATVVSQIPPVAFKTLLGRGDPRVFDDETAGCGRVPDPSAGYAKAGEEKDVRSVGTARCVACMLFSPCVC